jgi:hypothetical protein
MMMAAGHAPTGTLATWPIRFRCVLLLLVFSGLGCVDLTKPWALTHPDGSAAGSPGGEGGANTVTSGTGGFGPATGGASGGTAIGAGKGGNTGTSPVALDASGAGGSGEIDAPSAADRPLSTGGLAFDAGEGSGGSAGQTGRGGSTGTGVDAGAGSTGAGGSAGQTGGAGSTGTGGSVGQTGGAGGTGTGFDAGAGGGVGGRTSGVGGTIGTGGAAGQAGGAGGGITIPDAAPDSPPDAPCVLCAIGTTLVHRYNFNGTATTVTDSVGTAHGTVRNAQLSGQGTLVLAGGTSDQYADMPDRILSTLTSATLEIWVTWTGGNNNQRILDFGSSTESGGSYYAVTTVIISPNSAPDGTPRLRASYSSDVETSSTFVDAPSTLPTGTIQQIVVVFDGQSHTMSMYRNGVLQGQATGLGALSLIDDVNNYLGKSQYSGDPGFGGTYHEFRMYNAPLTAEQVQTLYAAGQNASFTQ